MHQSVLKVNCRLSSGCAAIDSESRVNDQVSEAEAEAKAGDRRNSFWWRWRYPLLLVPVALALLFYATIPTLLGYAASAIGTRLGLSELVIETGYPRLDTLNVHRLELMGDGFRLQASGGRLTYDPGDLLRGRLESVSFDFVEVTLSESSTSVASGVDAGGGADALMLERWSTRLPFAVARVEDLQVRVPHMNFLAGGGLTYGENRLALTLSGRAPEAAGRFELDAELSGQGLVTIRFRERDSDRPPFLTAVSSLESEALVVDADVQLSGYAFQLARELAGLPAGEGIVQAALKMRTPWPLPDDLRWQDLNGSGPFSLVWVSADGSIQIDELAGNLSLADGAVDATVAGRLGLQQQDLSLSARLPEDFALRFDGDRLTGGTGMAVSLQSPEVSAQGSVSRFAVDVGDTETRVEVTADITARTEVVNLDGQLEAAIRPAAPDGYSGTVDFSGAVAADSLRLDTQVESMLMLTGDLLTAQGSAAAGSLGDLSLAVRYNLQTGAGSADVVGAAEVSKPFMASVLTPWKEPFDLHAGRLGYMLDLDWDRTHAPGGRITVSLADADLRYEEYRVNGLNGEFDLRVKGDAWFFDETPVTAESVDLGVVAKNLSAFVTWSGSQVTVREFSAALLGGGVVAEPFSYFPGTGYGSLELRLVGLSLSEVLALEGDDVTGTGRLNGLIPIALLDNAVSVSGGKVKAAPPGGTIRVSTELSGPTGQPGLDFALLALKNFNYTLLEAEVDYAESGDLQLAVHLQGRNPEVEAGRPIHYNLNINENIPVLLRSLRLQDQVVRQVERRVRN